MRCDIDIEIEIELQDGSATGRQEVKSRDWMPYLQNYCNQDRAMRSSQGEILEEKEEPSKKMEDRPGKQERIGREKAHKGKKQTFFCIGKTVKCYRGMTPTVMPTWWK